MKALPEKGLIINREAVDWFPNLNGLDLLLDSSFFSAFARGIPFLM